jgi:hypothetical protein
LIDTWLREDLAGVANDALKDGVVPRFDDCMHQYAIQAQSRGETGYRAAVSAVGIADLVSDSGQATNPREARAPRFADYDREAFELLGFPASDHARKGVHMHRTWSRRGYHYRDCN